MKKTELRPTEQSEIIHQFLQLIARTDTDNPAEEDVKALRQMLHDKPNLWNQAGELAELAATHLIENTAGSVALKECLKIGWKAKLDAMDYPQAPIMERLLIELIVLCWMRLYLLELQYSSAMTKGLSVTQDQFWQKRISAAQQRFRGACETLARIRKLSRSTPTLQVNIASDVGQQVNIASNHSGR